ncbi:MAG: superoxide dismutase [Bacteroidota bacterium]
MRKTKILLIPFIVVILISCQTGDKEKSQQETGDNKAQTEESTKKLTDEGLPASEYGFGDLPYAANALEPVINSEIMRLHYGKHHKGYYKKFLNALDSKSYERKDLAYIFSHIDNYDTSVRNNGGGYYNHWVFWKNLSPDGGDKPGDDLLKAIEEDFGSWDDFVDAFSEAAATQFGSGWAWLISDKSGDLQVINTSNQDNPIMSITEEQGYPLLTLDVWEHAYYLQYKNDRGAYIDEFWNIINWEEVSNRYEMALEGEYFMP